VDDKVDNLRQQSLLITRVLTRCLRRSFVERRDSGTRSGISVLQFSRSVVALDEKNVRCFGRPSTCLTMADSG